MGRVYGLVGGVALLFVALVGTMRATTQEKITLTTAVYTDPGATEFRVSSLYLDRQGSEVRAIFAEVLPGTATFIMNGKTLLCSYNGTQADTFLRALNTMNFATTSLEKRVTLQCQSDGKLGAGTISGTPQ